MEQTTSTVVQPTATFRIQVSPGLTVKASDGAGTEEAAAPGSGTQPSYTWNAFLNDKPVFDKALDLPLERLISRSGLETPPPPSYGRYGDPSATRALSEAIFSADKPKIFSTKKPVEMVGALRSFLDDHDGYVRVQLQIDGADSDIHDLPWEYLAVPWSDDRPLAADERTPFAAPDRPAAARVSPERRTSTACPGRL